MDPVSAGLGAAGLLSSKEQNRKAESTANSAAKRGRALEDRATAIWDLLFKNVQKADAAGQFDPEKRIAALEKDTASYQSRDMGNLAGALRVSGYKPGDSEIGTRLDAVNMKYQRFFNEMSNKIRTDTFQEKQNAYSLPIQYLQPGIQGNQFRGQQALGGMQSPAGFASAMMPFLNAKKKPAGTVYGSGSDTSTG